MLEWERSLCFISLSSPLSIRKYDYWEHSQYYWTWQSLTLSCSSQFLYSFRCIYIYIILLLFSFGTMKWNFLEISQEHKCSFCFLSNFERPISCLEHASLISSIVLHNFASSMVVEWKDLKFAQFSNSSKMLKMQKISGIIIEKEHFLPQPCLQTCFD